MIGASGPIERRLPVVLLCAVTLVLCCVIFPPAGWWLPACFCLVPWLVAVCTAQRARLVYGASYLLGLGFFLINIRWLAGVTLAGHLALCLYYALTFPLAAWPIRHMYRKRCASMALVVPVVWVALEYLRSIGPIGFPWLLLAHTQYKRLTIIQISDLVGAYGVSFVLAMINGWIADLLIQPIFIRRTEQAGRAARLPIGSVTTMVVVAGALVYGGTQGAMRSRAEPGPTVAVVQGDFGMFVDGRRGRTSSEAMFRTYYELTRQAAQAKPDLIVLPETAWVGYCNDGFLECPRAELEEIRRIRYPSESVQDLAHYQTISKRRRDAFQSLCTETGVPMVLGAQALEWKPTAIPPRVEVFNSAFLLTPGAARPTARYDKIHLVLFGEYVPFRYRFHSIYKWLNAMTPWGRDGQEYSLTPGESFRVFEFSARSREGRAYRAGTPICYEEIMPYISRAFTRGPAGLENGKNIDMLLSISNDGWFDHSAELEQHLAAAVFRAIENRIGVARSVNTGTSALVDPDGRIHHRVVLSEERLREVEHLRPILKELHGTAESLHDRSSAGGQDAVYAQAFGRFSEILSRELAQQIGRIGAEYDFIRVRLADLLSRAQNPDDSGDRRPGYQVLKSQIEDDLETIDRWKEKPWTAPGYNIGELRCDSQITFYTRWGDRFAQLMLALTVVMALDWFIRRVRSRAREPVSQS